MEKKKYIMNVSNWLDNPKFEIKQDIKNFFLDKILAQSGVNQNFVKENFPNM